MTSAGGDKTDTERAVLRRVRGLEDVRRRAGRARDALVLGRRGQRSVSALGAELVLQVVVTVLTDPHRRRDLQPLDLRLETTAPGRRVGTGEGGEREDT